MYISIIESCADDRQVENIIKEWKKFIRIIKNISNESVKYVVILKDLRGKPVRRLMDRETAKELSIIPKQ